jgi:hypothetical protein
MLGDRGLQPADRLVEVSDRALSEADVVCNREIDLVGVPTTRSLNASSWSKRMAALSTSPTKHAAVSQCAGPVNQSWSRGRAFPGQKAGRPTHPSHPAHSAFEFDVHGGGHRW